MRQANSFQTKKRTVLIWLLLGGLVMFLESSSFANQNVTLTWIPSVDPTVAGYKIYYGVASHSYTSSVAAGNVTNTTLTGLANGTTYYFAATTYDTNGDESDFSNETSYNTPTNSPSVNPINSLTIGENSAKYTLTFTGVSSGLTNKNQKIKVTATSSNKKLIPSPSVSYKSPGATGKLSFKPAHNATGVAIITITINNNAKSNNIVTQQFTVTVTNVPTATNPKKFKFLATPTPVTGQVTKIVSTPQKVSEPKVETKAQSEINEIISALKAKIAAKETAASKPESTYLYEPSGDIDSTVKTAPSPAIAMPATLASMAHSPKQFSFTVSGTTSSQYVVQASTNLVDWVSIQTNAAPFIFADTNVNQFGQRFYRAVPLSQ